MNYFKKSGLSLLIIAISISLLAGCDKEKKADTATKDSLYSKETLVKYNDYVNLSNAINDDFLNARAYYLKNYSDENGNFKQLSSNDIFIPIRTPAETANAITTMKDSISETPSFPMDKGIQELSTDLANEIRILNDLQTYFAAKSYLDDDFVEARSLHKELVNSVKKSNKEIQTFNDAMQKINTEQQKFAAEKMEKSGELTPLALNNFISDSEKLIAELRKQEVTAANVVELDIASYEEYYNNLTKSYEEFIKASKDETQLQKEKLTSNNLVFLVKKATSIKAEATLLLNRAKTKQAIPESDLKNPIFIETTEGTPEKLIKEYNNLITDYNSSLSFHKKYPRRINSVGIIFIY
ncbi:DUF3829 domain-containing protein [Listeria monocytogenes]|nr:DUF3829 domain-containing protein [Listeria monocytogenes]EAG4305703.1 DUF3829 domain-containing protein [Listeria monocytogenes]EAW7127669.1 DUF3829 domain-containing protein [Listeria monocytogenes]EAW7129884.1 DUF3829 domain-containing protein [Listeria monocytogenes]EAW7192384.1 DUF3829 domain-containing protein [Listeria monocytogenes]